MKSTRNRKREELLVWVGVLVCLLASEMLLRAVETKLSIDIGHIRNTATTAQKIARGKQEGRLQILFMGNSLTREGIEPKMFANSVSATTQRGPDVHYFIPDGGNIEAWRMAWQRFFASRESSPDIVILSGGRSHFDDGVLDPIVAASNYCRWSDLPHYVLNYYDNFEDRIRFVAAKASTGYANRMRIQRRIRDMILPYNRIVLHEMTTQLAKSVPPGQERPMESQTLTALLNELQLRKVRSVVIAMPSFHNYSFPQDRVDRVRAAGAHLLDMRNTEGITPERFYDLAHVDEAGAKILTTAVIKKIRPAIETWTKLE